MKEERGGGEKQGGEEGSFRMKGQRLNRIYRGGEGSNRGANSVEYSVPLLVLDYYYSILLFYYYLLLAPGPQLKLANAHVSDGFVRPAIFGSPLIHWLLRKYSQKRKRIENGEYLILSLYSYSYSPYKCYCYCYTVYKERQSVLYAVSV